jgi:hypothetical protein
MRIPKVTNMNSPRTGNPVANQFVIDMDDMEVFQSYRTVIGTKRRGEVILDEDSWDYSLTTGKYRNQWLGLTTKETKDQIADGRIKLEDLNK